MTEISATLVLGAILALALCYWTTSGSRRKLNLPPNLPRGRPKQKPWVYFTEQAKKLGEITSFKQNGRVTIVINSAEAAHALLEERSSIYSSRPPLHVLSTARNGAMGGWTPYGETFKRWRKVVHSALNGKSAEDYRPWQQGESAILLHRLLEKPENWSRYVEEFATCVATMISYGYRPKNLDTDDMLKRNFEAEHGEVTYATNQSVVERWPLLRFAPSIFVPILAEARQSRETDGKFFKGLFDEVKVRADRSASLLITISARSAIRSGKAPWSFSRDVHSEPLSSYGLSHQELAYAASVPLSTGIVTTQGSIQLYLLACAKWGKDFLPKLQKELDAAVGTERLPTYADIEGLPYLKAVTKESVRWGQIAPLVLPHAVIEDDVYKGYDIPKGSTVLLNAYAIKNDEKHYKDAKRFWPDRWLEDNKKDFPTAHGHVGWGLGRRVCPGMHVAEASLNIIHARIAWAFDVIVTGEPDMSETNYTDEGIGSRPIKIPITFRVRSPKHKKLIEQEFRMAMFELEQAETS